MTVDQVAGLVYGIFPLRDQVEIVGQPLQQFGPRLSAEIELQQAVLIGPKF